MSEHFEPVADNDSISELFGISLPDGLVPDHLQGVKNKLDLVTWNIKYFDLKSADRVRLIGRIMREIAADIFVMQEIDSGAMEPVANFLNDIGAGAYTVAQGTTGGNQRVTILYDQNWVRSTTNPKELFAGEMTSEGKDAFPRLPLHMRMIVKSPGEIDPFEFELAGVHLKSQRGANRSESQREKAAQVIAKWLTSPALSGEDVIIAGDWNASPEKPEWKAIRELGEKVRFESWNDGSEGSHLSSNGHSTRLDLIVVSNSASQKGDTQKAEVINWNEVLKKKTTLQKVIDQISDHRPVLSRFHFREKV